MSQISHIMSLFTKYNLRYHLNSVNLCSFTCRLLQYIRLDSQVDRSPNTIPAFSNPLCAGSTVSLVCL